METLKSYNPANGELLGEVAVTRPDKIPAVVDRARATQPAWEALSHDERARLLAKAAEGRFLQLEVNRGLPAKYLVKYFTRHNLEWQIKPELRAMVQWRKFNLKDTPLHLGHFDIVFCRNVLIYFDIETKRRILNRIKQTMQPGSYLILGSSETTLNVDDTFSRRKVDRAILYQKPET